MNTNFNRRDAIKKIGLGVGTAASLPSLLKPKNSQANPHSRPQGSGAKSFDKKNIAIIGSGMGSIGLAWLIGHDHCIDIFESRHKIGGNCDSHPVNYMGRTIYTDLGAQFCHPKTHPIYFSLLEEMGLHNPDNPYQSILFSAKGSMCVFNQDTNQTIFASKTPLLNLKRALEFNKLIKPFQEMVKQSVSYDITVREWLEKVDISESFKNDFLLMWFASNIGGNLDQVMDYPIRTLLDPIASLMSSNPLNPTKTWNSSIGLQGVLNKVLKDSKNTTTYLGQAVTELRKESKGWIIKTSHADFGPYDEVIINAQPMHSKFFLNESSETQPIRNLFDCYKYYPTKIIIHTDPIYMPKNKSVWSVYNTGIFDDQYCEGSVWLGALHKPIQNGLRSAPVNIFKSWGTYRKEMPKEILAQRVYQHTLATKKVIQAKRDLQEFQGKNNLWFSGQFTMGSGSQNSAFYSAMKVAERVSPTSKRLKAIKSRLRQKGIQEYGHDV